MEIANIKTLKDPSTNEAIAPRTTVGALNGTGKKGQLVGFTEENVVGVVDAPPSITVSSVDLTAGSSSLASGSLWFVYEE